MKWRILDANNNTLTLISETAANTGFTLSGANGYNNGVLLLNNACKAMYSNSSLGATGRSLNIDDIEDYMTYNKNSYFDYGKEFSPRYKNYPTIFANELNGAPNGTYGTELDLSEQDEYITGILTGNSSFKGRKTYYYLTMSTSTMNNQTYVDLFSSSTEEWLASRCSYYDDDKAAFDMFFVNGNTVDARNIYISTNFPYSYSHAIRPIVEIDLTKASVGLTGDGGVDTPYSIEAK